jgi:hypothetical protein
MQNKEDIMNWKLFCNIEGLQELEIGKLRELARAGFENYRIYPESLQRNGGSLFFITWHDGRKVLAVYGESQAYHELTGMEILIETGKVKVCELSTENVAVIRRIFPFTAPRNHRGIAITVGLGDRLGLASAGHIRLVRNYPVFPVLAQQSIRELNLTGRTYPDVLTAASWAVFQEGYISGFGADGDHLKTAAEVQMALKAGFTMITLDCSEHIDNTVSALDDAEVDRRYARIPAEQKNRLESKYLGKEFSLAGAAVSFSPQEFKRIVLIYSKAVQYTIDLYQAVIKNCGRPVDFEMSIDETLTSTTPASHYFVASELIGAGVEVASLAPRFCGEFQKGIDYIGDKAQFAAEFALHVKIAEHFGYKISIHSGSDKFGVFPVIGAESGGKYHLKTAGTNWLEAVRLIAAQEPALYREMHRFAVANLSEAKKYYHIKADLAKVPEIDSLTDAELPGLMDQDDSRQVLHITYGLILSAQHSDGRPVFRDRIYRTLNQNEAGYYQGLERHIGKHLELLGLV